MKKLMYTSVALFVLSCFVLVGCSTIEIQDSIDSANGNLQGTQPPKTAPPTTTKPTPTTVTKPTPPPTTTQPTPPPTTTADAGTTTPPPPDKKGITKCGVNSYGVKIPFCQTSTGARGLTGYHYQCYGQKFVEVKYAQCTPTTQAQNDAAAACKNVCVTYP